MSDELICVNCDEPVRKSFPMITFFTGSHVTIEELVVHTDSGDERCGYVGHWMESCAEVRDER